MLNNDTLKTNPTIMTIIINIQTMSKMKGNEKTFDELENKTYQELSIIQDSLIRKLK